MSFVLVGPEMEAAAAAQLAGVGSSLNTAHAVAAIPTTTVLAAAGDEVSAAVASLFSSFGRDYQYLSAQVATFHDLFVRAMHTAASSYGAAEAAGASALASASAHPTASFSPLALVKDLTGRALIGNGNDSAAGSGAAGEDGGWLLGNGGAGGSGAAPTAMPASAAPTAPPPPPSAPTEAAAPTARPARTARAAQPSESNCFLRTLPIALRGNASTMRTSRGRLCTESCWAT